MDLLDIGAAVVVVDFVTVSLSKVFNFGKSLDKWYAKFGLLALLSDCLIIVLGIQLAIILAPQAQPYHVALIALAIQVTHDILFYFLVVDALPAGRNEIIDLFKEYAAENSWKVVVADSLMLLSTITLASLFHMYDTNLIVFIGLLGTYALTYIIYTH